MKQIVEGTLQVSPINNAEYPLILSVDAKGLSLDDRALTRVPQKNHNYYFMFFFK